MHPKHPHLLSRQCTPLTFCLSQQLVAPVGDLRGYFSRLLHASTSQNVTYRGRIFPPHPRKVTIKCIDEPAERLHTNTLDPANGQQVHVEILDVGA
jgi:hypothetical protein